MERKYLISPFLIKRKDILEIFSAGGGGYGSKKIFQVNKKWGQNMKLADSNIEEYKREGLTIPDYKLSENVINQLSDIGELVEAFPIPSEYLLAPHLQ